MTDGPLWDDDAVNRLLIHADYLGRQGRGQLAELLRLAVKRSEDLGVKWELYRDVKGYEAMEVLGPRIDKLYMALNARARGDENDLDGDPAEPWNRLVGALADALVHWVWYGRWAVNEHQRNERLSAMLREAADMLTSEDCYDPSDLLARIDAEALSQFPAGRNEGRTRQTGGSTGGDDA